MENGIIVYIPSETKAAPHLSMKNFLGVPLFLRGILTLADAGYRRFTLLIPLSERRHALKAWEHHTKGRDLQPHFVWTPSSQRINKRILAEVIQNSRETITILNANLLLTKGTLDPWADVDLRKGQHLKAVIDRGLPPIIKLKRSDLQGMENYIPDEGWTIEEIIEDLLKKTAAHPVSKRWNEPVRLVTRFTNKGEAIKFLTEKIRMDTPMWIARNINKRISLPVSVILARLRVRPNTITMFNMLIGMGASVGAAGRTYTGLLIGAILFQLASIIDGCDGEVAKLTHRCSKFGQYIDSISDNFALAGFYTGLMIHIYRVNNHTHWAFVWGGALLVGFFIILGFMINFLKKNTDSASFATFDTEFLEKLSSSYPKPLLLLIKYGKYTLKKDFFSFLFLVLAILGILPAAFYLSIVGCWIGIAVLVYLNLKPSPATQVIASRSSLPSSACGCNSKTSRRICQGEPGKRLVVFDFDGTLVDSMGRFADIAARVMNEIYGTPLEIGRKQYIESSGIPFFQQLEEIQPGNKDNEAAAKRFEKEKLLDYFNQKVYPDVAPTTEWLKKRGILTATSSNNFQNLVDEFARRSGLKLDYVLGYRTKDFCKGESHFKYLLAQTGLERGQLIFVGDSLKDAERAGSFNIDFIGKTGLFSKEDFEKGFPESRTIDNICELTELI